MSISFLSDILYSRIKKQQQEQGKLYVIPLPHGAYMLVREIDINQLCHHIKVPGGVKSNWQKTWILSWTLKDQ